jgi:RNA polymerase sigma-70 factor (ECF subfamily)
MAATAFLFSVFTRADPRSVARGLRRRDPEVLDWLIEQYQYRLFRYLLCITGSREMAEDVFQETWMRVLERGRQYDGKSKFEMWLFSISRHLVIDLQRRKTPQSLEALTHPDCNGSPELAAHDPSPLDLFSCLEEKASIRTWLGRLPAIHREVLVLRFQEDLSLDEIAVVLTLPLSTVKSRLYRALQLLRESVKRDST